MRVQRANGGLATMAPLGRLGDLHREMDRLFDGFRPERWTEARGWMPALDVHEAADEIRCTLELPGVDPDDVEIELEQNVLTVSGEKRLDPDDDRSNYRFSERRYGRFVRSIDLPRAIDADHVTARYENGLLMIAVPKAEEAKARRIRVEAQPSGRRIEGKAE